MNTTSQCSQCGKSLEPDALLGLCPECLMKAGLPAPAKATIRVALDAFVEGADTETKEFTPGTKLGYIGDYELLEEIARGGMGVVYKARQSSLKRIVAVKMIRSGELAGEAEVKRFHTEAEAAAQLQHPGIVAIHEIGEHEGRHYFSMDFVEGRNLAQIANGKPVAPQLAAEWLKAIAEAVQFAHQRGVLHRDLKPQNIMLDSAGRPRVTDFGLAKHLGSDSTLTNTGAIMGSPSYMSPEQARGRNDLIGPASDVYSLGAILYELLTGRPPFRGKTPMDTLSQVVNDEPPRPRSLNPAAPADLETICLKCLEKEPAQRYPTARELEADLGRFLSGEPVLAQPANAFRRTMSWLRRHPWMLGVVLSVLVLVLAENAYRYREETRHLIWLNAHPGLTRAPGQQGAELNAVSRWVLTWGIGWGLAAVSAAMLAGAVLRHWFKGHPSVKDFIWGLAHPKTPGAAAKFEAMALYWKLLFNLMLIGYALFYEASSIHASVWDGVDQSLFLLALEYYIFYLGVTGLIRLVREQMRIPIEPRPEAKPAPLSPEQFTPIQEALYAGRSKDALTLYREATGDANRMNLLRILAELKRAHPEKFPARGLIQKLPARVLNPLRFISSFFQGRRGWVLLGSIILLCGLRMLALQQPFSKIILNDLGLGLGVGASARLSWFLIRRSIGHAESDAADSFGVVGWKKAYRTILLLIRVLTRMVIAVLAFFTLVFDIFFIFVAVPGTIGASLNHDAPPGSGFLFCGWLVAGWLLMHLLIHLVVKMHVAKPSHLADYPMAKPVPLSPEQEQAQIHQAIFAGRRNEAVMLYRKATLAKAAVGLAEAFADIGRMEAELKQTQPEKFSTAVLNQPPVDLAKRAERGRLLWYGICLVIGLSIIAAELLGSVIWSLLWPLYWLATGFIFGAFGRRVSWKNAYREMRRDIKFAAWFLVTVFTMAIVMGVINVLAHPILNAAKLFSVITHPEVHSPAAGNVVLCMFGLLAGWLLVHLRLSRRKGP